MIFPLYKSKELNAFQIGYVVEHSVPKKTPLGTMSSLFGYVRRIAILLVAYGLFCVAMSPEPLPQFTNNMLHFGVWFFMLLKCIGVTTFVICFAVLLLPLLIDPDSNGTAKIVRAMLPAIGKPSWKSHMASMVEDIASVSFLCGLILSGWTFFAVCYVFLMLATLAITYFLRKAMLSHLKKLTPETVANFDREEAPIIDLLQNGQNAGNN